MITKLVLLGKNLVSASEDCTCCVWDIQSRQIISTVRHKGLWSLMYIIFIYTAVAAITDMIVCDDSLIIQPKLQLSFDLLVIKQFTRTVLYRNEENTKEETKLTVPVIPRKINLVSNYNSHLLLEINGALFWTSVTAEWYGL